MKKVRRGVKNIFGFLVVLALSGWWLVTFYKSVPLNILYEIIPQYAYLDKYILKDGEASLGEWIKFSEGGEGKKSDFVGKRIHFATYVGEDGGWGDIYVYKGMESNEVTEDWQWDAQDYPGGYVELRWGKAEKMPRGFAEIDGVITDVDELDEITPVIYVKKIEKKDFEDIEWEDRQVMTEKDFEVKKVIKPDIEFTSGGIKRSFQSIEFSDMGVKLTFIPDKLKETYNTEDVGGAMGQAEIDYNGKKYRMYPIAHGENGYVAKETFF